MTISPERERQLCAWSTNPGDALRAIQFLLTRVRELEAEIKATDILLVTLNEREDDLIAALECINEGLDAEYRPNRSYITLAREALKEQPCGKTDSTG